MSEPSLDDRVQHGEILVGEAPMRLLSPPPASGTSLAGGFAVPPARRASSPLRADAMRRGRVLVSTLPNIHRHACIAQVADLHELAHTYARGARIVHISADAPEHWREVDLYHGDVTAAGYSLAGASAADRAAFTSAFGVGVVGSPRIAHGLFALEGGVFRVVHIPYQQMGAPDVAAFLVAAARGRGDD